MPVNSDECLLTRMEEISLDYHITVEQELGSSTHAFFGFNGTGGIWRIKAINAAGGWNNRTTVEDMDPAVRAGLKGWKFLYLGDLQVVLVDYRLSQKLKELRNLNIIHNLGVSKFAALILMYGSDITIYKQC